MPRNRPVGGSYGGRVTQIGGAERGREVVAADEREPLGHRRVGRHDDGLGGHQTAGGVRGVEQQHAHVVGLFRLHELEQRLAALVAAAAR